ncbi:hypothetical protein QJS10_CPA09g01673 [Acorus calamus]|uniref:AT-hook motif nuclear-localized protein n=1 Tax=Acorus calamus TaxID=4465 RepID=A0AAV9E3F1_ACOCL|nr:hypothetical protein QJS10_CPA09g01673 [Acorus calamus]
MDGSDEMGMSGASYYMHRGMGGSSSLGTLHGASPPGIRPCSGGGGVGGGSMFHVNSQASGVPQYIGVNVGESGGQSGETVKRKRGRPRKYGPDGTVALALSPMSSPASGLGPGSGSVSMSGPASTTPKRGRGRPPGTGRKQQLAAVGEWMIGSAGMGFTPHVITISIGEGPRAVCILSANGAVSTVTLRQPATSGGTVTYEGRFEILCLSGSYLLTDNTGSRNRTGGLSVSLSSPDGRVIGGGVGGMLIAASQVQVIVGSFIYSGSKAKNKGKIGPESGAESDQPTSDRTTTPSSMPPTQNLTPTSMMGGWPGSRQMDMRNAHMDIDLMRG